MKARDVMVSPVITVKPSSSVREVAQTLLKERISAVPVVDDQGKLVGIISEGDLLHRAEAGTQRRHSWWLVGLVGDESLASEYIKAHSRKVADVMTRKVVTAAPDSPLHQIAALLEKNSIKRVPIVANGQVVGIVSRANLIQALATFRHKMLEQQPVADAELRKKVMSRLQSEPWVRPNLVNVTVSGGNVDLWGIVDSAAEKQALRVAVEIVPGVKGINDNVVVRPAGAGT